MLKVKTTDLTGGALDWAVAKCEYDQRRYNYGSPCFNSNTKRVYETEGLRQIGVTFAPSIDWKQGGPVIERWEIDLNKVGTSTWRAKTISLGRFYDATGTTPLIAAMRCYVASKLGDTLEIPEELIKC